MTQYAGQSINGDITLLRTEKEMGLSSEQLFTEHDRRASFKLINGTLDEGRRPEVISRLKEIAETPYSHQASYFLERIGITLEEISTEFKFPETAEEEQARVDAYLRETYTPPASAARTAEELYSRGVDDPYGAIEQE